MSIPIKKRDTARGLIIKDGCVLLIVRIRPGMRYFSTPGGEIEEGETPVQAVVREITEETSLEVKVEREVCVWKEGPHTHHFFLCSYISGEPKLSEDAEEAQDGPGYSHEPKWISFDEIKADSFGYWEPVRGLILEGAKNGFPDNIVYLTA